MMESVLFFYKVSKPGQKCVSNAVLVGDNLKATKDMDQKLRETPHEDESYLETLRNNYGTGCSSILDIARISSGFNPFETEVSVFNKYIKALTSSPFFAMNKFETANHHRGESNWDSAINSIVDLYDGVKDNDKAGIKNSLVNLAKSASTKLDIRNSETLFLQSVIQVNEGNVTAFLYSSSIDLEETTKKGFESKQLDVSIKKLELTFNEQLWHQYAHLINQKTVKLITDWADDNSIDETEQLMKTKVCLKYAPEKSE